MSSRELTDLIIALLHSVVGPRHHRCGRCGGWWQRYPVLAPAPPPPPPSAAQHHHVLERPQSPSPDRPTYQSMESSDPGASTWGHRGQSCAIHGWGCTNPQALVIEPSGGEGRRRWWASHHDGHWPRRAADDTPDGTHLHWSMGPTPRTVTTPPTSPTLSLVMPPLPSALSSPEAGPSGSSTSSDLLSPFHRPILQRPRARVLGLNGRAEPLSGDDGRRGATPRKECTRVRFSVGEGHQEEEQAGEY
jgi:hypothetical protein